MKLYLLAAAICSLLFVSQTAQAGVAPEEAAKMEGQYTTVTGRVESARRSNGGSLYLNFGAAYPNHTFSVFVSKSDALNFPEADTYQGKTVSVTGTITMREGKPQMQIKTPEDVVVADAPVASPSPTTP